MSIQYTYTVTSVRPDLKTMEVEYSAAGYSTKLIGMPMPIQGQTLEQVVTQYAPLNDWLIESTPVVSVQVGQTGSVQPVESVQPGPASTTVITVGRIVA